MKPSYLLLAVTNLLLMSLVSIFGLSVNGAAGFERHFLLGVLAAMFGCFVHVVTFMYFVVQEKIIRQACLSGGLDAAFHDVIMSMKSRAIRLSMLGIMTIVLTAAAGAAIGIYLPASVHMLAAFAAILANAILMVYQSALIDAFGQVARRAFPEG